MVQDKVTKAFTCSALEFRRLPGDLCYWGHLPHFRLEAGRLGSRFLLLSLKEDYLRELGDIIVEAGSYSEASLQNSNVMKWPTSH